jgi:hypothetical protein
MIDLTGNGVLALWNGVEPSRAREYHVWHTREHVSERVSVPGILGARRYARLHGPLPEFLTLYALEDTGVLTSAPYQTLLNNPTEWSRSMRPSLHDFMRVCCRRNHSAGGGLGSTLIAATFGNDADIQTEPMTAWIERALAYDAISAAHLLQRDPSVPGVPFAVGGAAPEVPQAGVILLEGYGPDLFPAAAGHLASLKFGAVKDTMTAYRLAYALDRGSLAHVARMTKKA